MGNPNFWLPEDVDTETAVKQWERIVKFARKECGPRSELVIPAWLLLWADAYWQFYADLYAELVQSIKEKESV